MNKKKYPKGPQFNVRVTAVELRRLKEAAESQGMSLSDYVRTAIRSVIYVPADGKLFT